MKGRRSDPHIEITMSRGCWPVRGGPEVACGNCKNDLVIFMFRLFMTMS